MKIDLDITSFDPQFLIEEVASLLAESAQGKGLELVAYCHSDVPARLAGDAGRIRQVLLNLASNAVKFTASGEVAIRVTIVDQDASTALVRFEVRGTGIGIDAADHVRLFGSFSQADASTTRRYGGTGLGLAICRRLTEVMGGAIGLTSTPGEGSTFWFALRLPPAKEPGRVSDRPVRSPLTGLRALVVDDNATNRLMLESPAEHPAHDADVRFTGIQNRYDRCGNQRMAHETCPRLGTLRSSDAAGSWRPSDRIGRPHLNGP